MTAAHDKEIFDLGGRVALITGGAGLIGTRIAKGLAAFGAAVVLADIDEEQARVRADEVASASGVRCIGLGCDVGDPDSVARMVERTCDELGGIHVLFNNAASQTGNLKNFYVPFENFPLEHWRRVMSVNIDGMFLVAQAVGRRMKQQRKGGSVVQTSSIYGLVGPDFRIYEGSARLGEPMSSPAVYSASKAAVMGLTRYLATYWAGAGIRVNTLVPGGVDDGINETFRRNYASRVPLGRMAKVDELVGAAVFLASDASSYVTGQELVVDGGWTAW